MPQKPYFARPPLVSIKNTFPANGTFRTKDERIRRLYQTANQWIDKACLWEGLFNLACLLKSRPLEEPVVQQIKNGLYDAGNGALEGTTAEQVYTARAALALYEYSTEHSILKRIADWLRYLEVEFDHLIVQDMLLYKPADLMELLVKFYQITGMKSVLRLCAKLRAAAFDWTTVQHTFQQSVPLSCNTFQSSVLTLLSPPAELSFDEKQKLINHAEILADSVRYTIYSGMYSGHSQDLSAGKTVWKQLVKHHRAICGGTTANPYLCGRGSDQPVRNTALAAWTEAFAAQMLLPGSEWAVDEIIRIVFNGLDDCLNHLRLYDEQYVNTLSVEDKPCIDESMLYARVTRSVATAFRHAVTLTPNGIRVNYLLPGKYLLMIDRQPFIIKTDRNTACIQCDKPFLAQIEVYHSQAGTARIIAVRDGHSVICDDFSTGCESGFCFHKTLEWHNGDVIRYEQDGSVFSETTHHQGICFLIENRLLSVEATDSAYHIAANGIPVVKNGVPNIRVEEVTDWPDKGKQISDIPVLPSGGHRSMIKVMKPYSETETRITMFPRINKGCLK